MKIDYSVVIRTLGLAGEKYQRMLNAISRQTIRPREVLVVLAEGYDLPPERLGYERYIYSKKGIVTQRSFGAREAKGEYCLFLDDDMDFAPNLVEELYKPIEQGIADVTFPLLTEMLPQKGMGSLFSCLTAAAIPMLFNKKGNYTRIIRSGGWTYNRNVDETKTNYYLAETAPGACYLASRAASLNIRFEEETWLELTSFSLPDDQINFYKYYKLGYRIYGVSNIQISHLDGGGNSPERRLKAAYALAKHKIIFWHRFIYVNDPLYFSKYLSCLCLIYWLLSSLTLGVFTAVLKMNFKEYSVSFTGIIDGFKFLKTREYKNLPKVILSNYKKN